MQTLTRNTLILAAYGGLLLNSACGGGGGSAPTPAMKYAVGGTVTGIIPAPGTGSQLVLAVQGADALFLNANGSFHFDRPLPAGTAYDVTIKIQPVAPPELCTVANGSGQAGPTSVSAVSVSCSLARFTVGGTVSGLTGSGLVLTDNGGDALPIAANGNFTFATPLTTGYTYSVGVKSQPTGQTCWASAKGVGSVGSGPVSNVQVTCYPNSYTVGVTVSGLQGAGPTLSLNLSYPGAAGPPTAMLNISGNGPAAFSPAVATQAGYQVNVVSQPAGSTQTCIVDDEQGFITSASVTLTVLCSTPHVAYGAGGHGNDVLAYSIDPASGALTALAGSPYAAGDTTSAIAIDPSNRFLYATNQGASGGAGSNTVSAYTIDAVTGVLHAVAGSPFASVNAPLSIAIEPTGRFAYVANLHDNTIAAYAINATTGALAPVTGGPAEAGVDGPRYLTAHPSGKFLYLSVGNEASVWAYTIDPASGALTAVAGSPFSVVFPAYFAVPTTVSPGPLSISPNGLYAALALGSVLTDVSTELGGAASFLIDPSTGALTSPSLGIFATGGSALAMDPGFNFAYLLDEPGEPFSTVRTGNGELSPGTVFVNPSVPAVDISQNNSSTASTITYPLSVPVTTVTADPSGRFVYVVDTSGAAHAFIIDYATGNLTAGAVTPAAFSAPQPLVITKQ